MSSDPLAATMAAIQAYLQRHRIPGAPAGGWAMALITLHPDHVGDLPAFLAQLGPPKTGGAWQGWLYGCVRHGLEAWAVDQQAIRQHRERALQEAALALAEAKERACKVCEGLGMVGARPECLADVRQALKLGVPLCECEAGAAWRQML